MILLCAVHRHKRVEGISKELHTNIVDVHATPSGPNVLVAISRPAPA